jgi:glycosyltransferase involved in cell wall biosynthesis
MNTSNINSSVAYGLRISIVMATYNGQAFLPEQLQSFLVQDRLPDELVVTDDGSTDDTLQIIQAFSETAPFVVNVFNNNQKRGCTSNFTNGILSSTGDIILLSDQDDVWLPQHVSKLVQELESDSELLSVASDSTCVDIELKPLGYSLRESERFYVHYIKEQHSAKDTHLKVTIRHFVAPGHGMAFRRTLIPYLAPMSDYWIHDQWIFLLASIIGKVSYVPDTLTYYRQHDKQSFGGQMSSLSSWADKTSNVLASRELADIYKWEDILKRCFEIKSTNQEISQTIIDLLLKKIEFSKQRVAIRKMPLVTRVIKTTILLLKRDYHMLARGIIAALRDVYGHR